jgi:uncharacterized protein (TIGR02271 family)
MTDVSSQSYRTVSAFFDSRQDAEDAIDRLVDAGIPEENGRLVPGNESDTTSTDTGEAHRGFFSALADFFMGEEDRHSYAEGLRRGGYLVVVNDLSDANYDIVVDILDDEGAVDFDAREESWRSEGWSGYGSDATSSGTSSPAISGTMAGSMASEDTGMRQRTSESGEETIPVVEEQLRVGKRDVNLGRVRVRSYVHEQPVSEQVNLRDERVTLERRPVDRPLSASDDAFQDRVIEADEHAEEAVVSKDTRVVEEVALRKEDTERQETINETVRRTEVEVEDDRDNTSGNTGTRDRR